MMTSAQSILRFTPREHQDEEGRALPGAPVYLVSPPTLFSRSEWRRELADKGAKAVSADSLYAMLRRGINTQVHEDQRAELLAFVDEYEASSSSLGDDLAELATRDPGEGSADGGAETVSSQYGDRVKAHAALMERMEDLEGQMRRMFPPYSRLLGEQTYWLENAPLVAAQMFLVGAEDTDVDVVREKGRVPIEVLGALPPGHAQEIGWFAISLMSAIGNAAKNSAGPSQSAANHSRSPRAKKARG